MSGGLKLAYPKLYWAECFLTTLRTPRLSQGKCPLHFRAYPTEIARRGHVRGNPGLQREVNANFRHII